MGCLYSVFDVKKQGKPVWVGRTRNWKLRGGENRLSRLLEGVPVSGNVFTWLSNEMMMFGGLDWACFQAYALSFPAMQIVSSGRQGSKGDRVKPLFKYDFCEYAQNSAIQVLSIGTLSVVSVPKSNTGIWVSVPAREGIGTPYYTPGLSCGMARPRGGGRRGGRRGGRAPVHLDEIGMEPVNDETLPPPPPAGGEANEGGAGPQGGVGHQAGVGPQAGQRPAVGDMSPLIQAIAGAFQTAMAGVQGAAQPQGGGNGLPLERLRHLGGVEFRGLPPGKSEAWLESTVRILGQMECTDARKLGCVVSLLQGDAYT
ncbi:hypothetical protein V6N13_133641 [Hibiscus sabdariffa]